MYYKSHAKWILQEFNFRIKRKSPGNVLFVTRIVISLTCILPNHPTWLHYVCNRFKSPLHYIMLMLVVDCLNAIYTYPRLNARSSD